MRARRDSDEAGEMRLCVDCEREGAAQPDFWLGDSEAEFYVSRNLRLPKRCPTHRAARRARNAGPSAA
jgi:hypothetical protein